MYLPPCCFVGFVVEIIMQENPRWGEKSPTFTLTRPFLPFLVEQENAPLHFAFPSPFEHPWICYCRLSLIVSLSSVLVFFSGKSRVSDFTNSCGISMIFFLLKMHLLKYLELLSPRESVLLKKFTQIKIYAIIFRWFLFGCPIRSRRQLSFWLGSLHAWNVVTLLGSLL